ncbi:MAG: LCP family protein [bacterium]
MAKKIELGKLNIDTEVSKPEKKVSTNSLIYKKNIEKINTPKESVLIGKEINGKKIGKYKKKNRIRKNILLFILLILVSGLGFVGVKAYQAMNSFNKAGVDINIVDVVKDAVAPKADPQLLKDGNITNVLLVGIDSRTGTGSDGLENTDSIMILSLNHVTKRVSMVSIPRDNQAIFFVGKDNKTAISDRINAAYYLAENNNYPTGGLGLLRTTLTQMTGLQIQYTVQVNFDAFKDIIDRIGGVTINVERSFIDYEYPTDNYGYQTVKFNAGEQTMTGETALKYARSRHSLGPEGSDFARAKRQQNVVAAVQAKIKTTNFVTDPGAASDFISIFGDSVKIQKTENSSAPIQKIDFSSDIKAILALKDTVNMNFITSLVLDPSIGGTNSIIHRLDTEAYLIGPTLGYGKYDDYKRYVDFAINNPDVYLENKFNYDIPKTYAEIGFVDAGLGYAKTLAEAKSLNSDFISSTYLTQIKGPIVLQKADTTKNISELDLTNVGIYDSTQTKPATLEYLTKKYGAKVLTADVVPDSVKKLKGYDIILIFPTKTE